MVSQTRKPSVVRRKEIASAVLHIIGQQGLTSLTTAAIAREVGLTTGALFRHFETLDDIYREVVRLALLEIKDTFPSDSIPPLERIFQLARNRIYLLNPNRGLTWLLRSEQAYLTLPQDAVSQLRLVAKRTHDFLLKAIQDGIADGSIRADIPADELLVPIIGSIHTLIGAPFASTQRSKKHHEKIDRVLHALKRMVAHPEGTVS